MPGKQLPIEEQLVAQMHDPTTAEEHPGLHPVQPGLVPFLEPDDLALEICVVQDCEGLQVLASAVHADKEVALSQTPKRKQIWGLRRRTFWLLFGAVVLIAVVAAVVGGILGSRPSSA
jgi:hypothetical protein